MKENILYAIDKTDGFEAPIYVWGEEQARRLAKKLNRHQWRGDNYNYLSKVRIERSGAFEYYDIDGL